jgi:long-chain fatty acid transport protein
MNNKITTIMILAGASLSTSVMATNGYQLIGIGGYQKSLAGAVTANPGSAMTAITNPAGMARIGKRADFSLEMFSPDRYVDFTAMGGQKNDSAADQYGVPALGWTAPIEDGSDVYFGGGIYGTSGMGTDYPITLMAAANPMGPTPDIYFEGYSAIQFWQMAPTIAWNQGDDLSFGVSLNIDYQSVALKQSFVGDNNADGNAETDLVNIDLSRSAQAFGFGISLGVMYDVNEQLTVGASYKSKQKFGDLDYNLGYGDIVGNGNFQMPLTACGTPDGMNRYICPAGTYTLGLDFPEIIAAGLAYSPIAPLTISFDIKQIKWSDTLDTMQITGPNGIVVTMPAGWDDQTVIALGFEYAVNDRLNLRLGFNRADSPIGPEDAGNNLILPAVVEDHIAFGGDWRMNNHWDLGFHISRASSNTVTSNSALTPGAKIGLEITTVGVNLGYRF